MFVHIRTPIVAPLARPLAYGDSLTPGTYCGRRGVPSGLSAPQLKDVEAVARGLGAKVCPSCLKAKSDEDRLN